MAATKTVSHFPELLNPSMGFSLFLVMASSSASIADICSLKMGSALPANTADFRELDTE